MTESTTDQERWMKAANSVAAKLQTLQDGLTAEERQVLGLAVGATTATRAEEDVAGFADTDPLGPVRDWCLTWQYPWGIPRWPLPQPARRE